MTSINSDIFESAPEFVGYDPRRLRQHTQTVTAESLFKRLQVHLPEDLIPGASVLDLGCALAAAGYYAFLLGCRSYTGVEINQYYADKANELLNKYIPNRDWLIVHQEIGEFLDDAIAQLKQWDYVIASGVLYAFLDQVGIIKKISQVADKYVLIDTAQWGESKNPHCGLIGIYSQQYMNSPVDSDTNDTVEALAARCSPRAIEYIMQNFGFNKDQDILPAPIVDTHDPYRTIEHIEDGSFLPKRKIVRYKRDVVKRKTVLERLQDRNTVVTDTQNTMPWKFDDQVADRFQQEAVTNIPSYEAVVDKCVNFAVSHVDRHDKIIDVGSALGYTIKKLHDAGFINVCGVDSSPAMAAKSYVPDLITVSDRLPQDTYKLVLANWTLHFVQDKVSYFQDVYNCLEDNGYFIVTDKTTQSNTLQELYYDWKMSNGVTAEYIAKKQQQLTNIMHTQNIEWYVKTLKSLRFKSCDIIHADLGFVTFLCVK